MNSVKLSKVKSSATLKIRGGCDRVGTVQNAQSEPGPDIICLEGNGSRPSHLGDGYSVGGAMYTLNSTEVHAVCYSSVYDSRGNGDGETCPTITGDHQNRITDYTAIVVQHEEALQQGEK